MTSSRKDALAAYAPLQRVVLKVGSAILAKGGPDIFARLGQQIGRVRQHGHEVVVVSSGAVALGLQAMKLNARPTAIALQQAAAAAGQPALMMRWTEALREVGPVAQVLLTHADLESRDRFLNARQALHALLECGIVPIINENDSVATEEIRVGDNDRLSAQVASLVDADLLVILTTVDGIFDADPEKNPAAKRLSLVTRPSDVAAYAGGAGSTGLGVGGMRTKIEAAQAAVSRSIPVVIAHGAQPDTLPKILAGEDVGSLFLPTRRVSSRKHWIGFTRRPKGVIHIDEGAGHAVLDAGRSLLASGIARVEGDFERGDMVEIHTPAGPIGRGLCAYDAADIRRIAGHKSDEIQAILGFVNTPEIIHRDDLVLIGHE